MQRTLQGTFSIGDTTESFHIIPSPINKVIGWLLHYVLGLVFVLGFHILLLMQWLSITWMSAFVYGIGIGLVGILGWHIMFSLADKNHR